MLRGFRHRAAVGTLRLQSWPRRSRRERGRAPRPGSVHQFGYRVVSCAEALAPLERGSLIDTNGVCRISDTDTAGHEQQRLSSLDHTLFGCCRANCRFDCLSLFRREWQRRCPGASVWSGYPGLRIDHAPHIAPTSIRWPIFWRAALVHHWLRRGSLGSRQDHLASKLQGHARRTRRARGCIGGCRAFREEPGARGREENHHSTP